MGKRNNKGQFETELEKAVMMSFWIEGETRSWLKEKAKKQSLSLGQFLRNLINHAIKAYKGK